MILHRWRDFQFQIAVSGRSGTRRFKLIPAIRESPNCQIQSSLEINRLRRASEIALEFDTSIQRKLKRGVSASLLIERSLHRPGQIVRSADEAIAFRPRIEELIAPLIFDTRNCTQLRQFQELGANWLCEHHARILADDMGLGKTAQALRAIEKLVHEGTIRSAIVVCPKSLLATWESECGKWVPQLTAIRALPVRRHADKVWASLIRRSHIIITNYEQLRPLPSPLGLTPMELVIADEAHRLRRSQARLVREIRLIETARLWALTGTPIERHPEDLATLLSLLAPARFSPKSDYSASDLRSQARPYLLRRLKSDVLHELPEIIESKEIIELTPRQTRAYTAARSTPLPNEAGQALQRINILRSICDADPDSESSSKIDRILEILEAIRIANEKAVVFSYKLHPLRVLLTRMGQQDPPIGAETLTGNLTTAERTQVIRRFKSEDATVALLCSSRVGGEGLTLTEANHVIFINEWWNPSANAQARDRVVRLGQERVVHVHRFRCKSTIEESLEQILESKGKEFTHIVDALASGEQPLDRNSEGLLNAVIRDIGPVNDLHG